jgi:hypothetical protein
VFKLQVGEWEEIASIEHLKPHRGAVSVQPAQPPARGQLAHPSHPHPQGLVLAGGHLAEKIDELVMLKIPQIVRAESASFIVPVYSTVYFQPPYKIHLSVNTVSVLFSVLLQYNERWGT